MCLPKTNFLLKITFFFNISIKRIVSAIYSDKYIFHLSKCGCSGNFSGDWIFLSTPSPNKFDKITLFSEFEMLNYPSKKKSTCVRFT